MQEHAPDTMVDRAPSKDTALNQTQREQRTAETTPYAMRRLGVVMRPQAGNALEAGGVLNPGGVRGPDGSYYLFPRLVAAGNYSRIGLARVVYDGQQTPCDVERLGVVLEPEAEYERNNLTGGGCEDPRVMHVPALGGYVMTYVGFGPLGPRAALALSTDLDHWTRLGLIDFAPIDGADMNAYGNKDALLFPDPVPDPAGRPALALMHRPMYEAWEHGSYEEARILPPPPGIAERRWSIWISYCPLERIDTSSPDRLQRTLRFDQHHLLAAPAYPWDNYRVGGGTPPILLPEGWFTIYHGISLVAPPHQPGSRRYCAGALILDPRQPNNIIYRSPEPTLAPETDEERSGVVSNVVFPTALDRREGYLDVYYGMADAAIGVARMDL